jgi:hypothetical protein
MRKPENITGKFAATLFALLFAILFPIGGTFGGIVPVYKQLSGWWQARSFVPIQAAVINATLQTHRDEGTTYQSIAQFKYRYDGRDYVSSTIGFGGGGSDNIGSYQQDIYQKLKKARDFAMPVELWVNPNQPGQAVYDRSIRWQLLIFSIPFAVLFPLVGIGAWWAIWRIWRGSNETKIFENDAVMFKGAGSVEIQGNAGGWIGLALAALFWNVLSWPLTIFPIIAAIQNHKWVALLLLLFPLVGIGLAIAAIRVWRAQRRIGKPVLILKQSAVPGHDPLQAAIRFEPALGERLNSSILSIPVSITIQCVDEDTRGEDTTSKVLWDSRVMQATIMRGTHTLDFQAELPAKMPASTIPRTQSVRIYWQVVLEACGGQIKFEIPVQSAVANNDEFVPNDAQPSYDPASVKNKYRRYIQAVMAVSAVYFIWVVVTDFAIPIYKDKNRGTLNPPTTAASKQPSVPVGKMPFRLDSLTGNGFGVVAKSTGEMEIRNNELLLFPETIIQLQSFGECNSDCPTIHAIEFELTKPLENSFKTISGSMPIAVHKDITNLQPLQVSISSEQVPLRIPIGDMNQFANLRLTLVIRGNVNGKEAFWYTHAVPFGKISTTGDAETRIADTGEPMGEQAFNALRDGRTNDIRKLLDAGMAVDVRNADGETLLMRTATQGNLPIAKLLIARGANVNAVTPINKEGNGGLTAMHSAMRVDAVDVVEALYKAGADPNAISNQVWTPMHYAAYRGATKSIRYLHQRGVPIDKPFNGGRGSTPMMVAVQEDRLDTIRLLLELGADQKQKDRYGEDACGYARFFKKAASSSLLSCN